MHNLLCLMPDGYIGITYWAWHPCDDELYMEEAWVWGPKGRVGYWMDRKVAAPDSPQPVAAPRTVARDSSR